MDIYNLYRNFWDFCFENPELVKPTHIAIFSFSVEHCNRLGWKQKFGFPTAMVMDAIGIKKYQTYVEHFNKLVDWGFFILIEKSKNQYSSNIISINSAMPKKGKALDKAIIKHGVKQLESTGKSMGESMDTIDIPIYHSTNIPIYKEGEESAPPKFKNLEKGILGKKENTEKKIAVKKEIEERIEDFKKEIYPFVEKYGKEMCKDFFNYWSEKTIDGKKMKKEEGSTWETSKRLATWEKHERKFNKNNLHNGKSKRERDSDERNENAKKALAMLKGE